MRRAGSSAAEGGELGGGGRPALEDGEIIGRGRTVREGARELRRRASHPQRFRHRPQSVDSDRDRQRCLDREFDEVIPCYQTISVISTNNITTGMLRGGRKYAFNSLKVRFSLS
jgi:hypothetical protein